MPAPAKKKMSAQLSMSLIESGELDGKTKKWIEGDKDLKKLYSQKFEYNEIVELDPRKWSNNKLKDALKDFVRYDMKIFAVRAAQYKKEVDANKADLKEVIKRAEADLGKSGRQLTKKISLAVEELVADKGNNARGMKDGKAAIKKLESVDLKKIFKEPGKLAADAMKKFANGLAAAGSDGKLQAKAQTKAKADMTNADKVFEEHSREARAASSAMEAIPKNVKKDAATELQGFAEKIKKHSAKFSAFETAMDAFGKQMDEAMKAINDSKPDAAAIQRLAGSLEASSKHTKTAEDVIKLLKELKPEFLKLEKEL